MTSSVTMHAKDFSPLIYIFDLVVVAYWDCGFASTSFYMHKILFIPLALKYLHFAYLLAVTDEALSNNNKKLKQVAL